MSELNVGQIKSGMIGHEDDPDQAACAELQHMYFNFYDLAPVGYYILDKKGHILEVNNTGADLLGFEKSDLIQRRFSHLIDPAFHDVFDFHQRRVLAGPSRGKCELRLIRKDGSRFDAQLESRAVKDASGDNARLLSVVTDVSESKIKTEELQRMKHDLGKRIKELNCLYEISKLIGDREHSLKEIVQEVIAIVPHCMQYAENSCARIILDGHTYQTDNFKETQWRQSAEISIHKSRIGVLEVFYLEERPEIYGRPFLDEERSLINAIASGLGHTIERIRDEDLLSKAYADLERKVDERTAELRRSNRQLQSEIEERRRIAEELSNTLDALREHREKLSRCERLSALGEVAAKITHEIKNPMVTIGGFARRMLKTNHISETNKESLKIIVEEIARLESILTDILFFAKPADPTCQMVSLNSIVHHSLEILRFDLEENSISFSEHLDPDLPMLCLDENQIRRVLHNLIRNAIEAMSEGGYLRVSTGKNQEWQVVEISDTGVGIADNDMHKLFDPFYSSKSSGSGLGLTISAQIISNHGGTIEVYNKAPQGTTFMIKLPPHHLLTIEHTERLGA